MRLADINEYLKREEYDTAQYFFKGRVSSSETLLSVLPIIRDSATRYFFFATGVKSLYILRFDTDEQIDGHNAISYTRISSPSIRSAGSLHSERKLDFYIDSAKKATLSCPYSKDTKEGFLCKSALRYIQTKSK